MGLLDGTAPAVPRRPLREYLEIPLRRPWLVTVPFLVVVAGSYLATRIVPKKFRASAFMLVESEKAPSSVAPHGAAQERADRHMQTIKGQILSRPRLEKVIKETSPYGDPDEFPMSDQVEWLRAATDITVRGPDSFDVDVVDADPDKAAEVANRIVALFVEENNRAQAQQVEKATSFLESQVGDARKELETKEEAIRRYKEAHMGSLPEQSIANLAALQHLQQQAQVVGDDLRAATDREADLEKQVAEASSGVSVAGLEGPDREISQLRGQLANLRARYTDDHPDVQQVLSRLRQLEASAPRATPSDPAGGAAASALDLRVEKARRDVAALQEKKNDLEQRIAALQSRIDSMPRVEQELTTIGRDFGNLKENYLGLVNKKLEAEMAGKLEEHWQGDRFRILDPAQAPDRPYFPNPFVFLGVGVVLGLGIGLGASVAAEFLDQSLKNLSDLETAVPYPLLAAVPFIRPDRPQKRRRTHKPKPATAAPADRSVLRL